MSRNISSKNYKLLYAQSAGRCNICGIKLINSKKSGDGSIHMGEMAHIHSFSNEAYARPRPIDMNNPDNTYENLILLCPNHHSEIDQDSITYTADKLKSIKKDFERNVDKKLSSIVHPDLELLGLINKYIDFQYLINEIQAPLNGLPSDITDIADLDNYILQRFTPTLYPFQDKNLQINIENVLFHYYTLRPYLIKYYFLNGNGRFVPVTQKPIKDKDKDEIINISKNLYNAIYHWLIYLRNI